jgi:sugar lactone lactonase YvrE
MKNSVRLALWALACLIFGSVTVNAQNNISTVVGGGPVALPGTTSSIGSPAAVRFDTAGNAYFLDNNFGRVIKQDTTGKVSVYAGNGTVGFSGDGGPATAAQMNGPSGMCLDTANNLYIADSDNAVIRRVAAATGIITTFAGVQTSTDMIYGGDGGLATAANLHFPDGCSFDSAGNLYIADRGNNEIRVIYEGGAVPVGVTAPVAGHIYKFAGGTDAAGTTPPSQNGGFSPDGTAANVAALYGPFDVFVDTSVTPNNVYYTEIGNHYDANGNPILTAPINNNIVREIVGSTGLIQTVAGKQGVFGADNNVAAVGAALNQPKGLSVDATGNIFFADQVNQVIREVPKATGIIGIVAGQFTHHGYAGDGGPATSGNASLTFPSGTLVDATGTLYIADQGSFAVRKVPNVTSGTSNISSIAGNGKLSYGGDGAAALSGELNTPAGLAVDSTGNIIIADSGSDLIRKVNGVTAPFDLSTIAGSPEANGFLNTPTSVVNVALGTAVDAAGNIYIADTLNCIIRKISGTTISTFAGIEPTIVNPDNSLANVPTCGFTAQAGAAVGTKLGFLNSVAVDSNGNVFFSDKTNNVIWEVPKATTPTMTAGSAYIVVGMQSTTGAFGGEGGPANQAQLSGPTGIYIDVYNNLFIADAGNHRIRVVPAGSTSTSTAGSIYTIAGNGTSGNTGNNGAATSATLATPFAIAVDNTGNVFFSDTTNQSVREIVGTTGDIKIVAGSLAGTAGFSGDGAAATSALLNGPQGLAIQTNAANKAASNLLISDSVNNRVRTVAGLANAAPVGIAVMTPNPLSFNAQPVGVASTATAVTVTNAGGATLTISAIQIGGIDATDFGETDNCVTPGTVAPGATCTINVTFTPAAVGTRTATLSVVNAIASGSASINVTGTGGTATATLTPTTLTFGSTIVGQPSATQAITLTNSGTATTLIPAGGITIMGANAGDFSETDTCAGGAGVAPGATCAITVTFKPTATGARTATLSVASNAGAASTATLNGTGGAATLTLTLKDTDSSSTQTVSAGATATYNLSLSGSQAVTATITCTGAPTAATCTPAPASVAVTPTAAGTFKVSITTTARSSMVPFTQPSTKMQPPSFMQIAPMATLALLFVIAMMLGWMQNEAGRARTLRVALSICLILMPIAAATVLVGCGGGSSSTPPPATGTPAGSYTITVTATSGSTNSTLALTLVVN